MNFIKELLADALNGLSLSQIPFLLFRLFMAAVLVYILTFIFNKRSGQERDPENKWMITLSLFTAFLAIISAYLLPLAILCLPVLFILVPFNTLDSIKQRMLYAISIGVGLACGAGYVFLAALFLLILIPIVLLLKK